MPQNETNTQMQAAPPEMLPIFIPFGHALYFWFLRAVNRVLIFLGLRSKQKFWGVVYDSITKQPLDPVIVRLIYADRPDRIETCITDLEGRYGFLVRPGKFKIFPKKSNYEFPSKIVQGTSDGPFDDVYHGEFLELVGEHEVLAPNIPMDPAAADWNQAAKLTLVNKKTGRDYFIKNLILVFFWFGFAFTLLFSSHDFILTRSLPLPLSAVLAAYLLLLLCKFLTSEVRLWGIVKLKGTNMTFPKLHLELSNPVMSSVVFGKGDVQDDGRFFVRANPGKYLLRVKYQEDGGPLQEIASLPVTIHNEGVLNATLEVGIPHDNGLIK